MITIVTRWESQQMDPELEWRMWRQLKGAFGINRFIFTPIIDEMSRYSFEQFATMEEALDALGDTPRAFLEPTGYNSITKLPQGDLALIFGNSHQHNMHLAKVNETFAIYVPAGQTQAHLYGTNAAAIALAVRHGQ